MSFEFNSLDEVADVVDSLHKTPTYSETGYPMVRGTDVKYGTLDLSSTFKVAETVFLDFSRKYKPSPKDIIITRVGTYGVTAQVKEINFCLGQNTAAIIPSQINADYLFYVLNSPYLKSQIESGVVGSTQKTLSLKVIKSFKIPRFDKSSEAEIASILSALDNRISLLRETNTTLEAIAQTLFKSWFVDFDPVKAKAEGRLPEGMSDATAALFPSDFEESALGLIPKGWRVRTLGDVVETVGGATPSTKETTFWEPSEFAWTTPKDLSGLQSPILLQTERKLSKKGIEKINSGLLPVGTLLLSSRAPIGYLAIAKIPVAINQGYIAMLPNGTLPPLYLLYWCKNNMDLINARANGSTFMEISKKAFRPIQLIVPSEATVRAFLQILDVLFDRLTENEKQSQTLTTLRDTLLPRLISGQLRLNQAQEIMDEVGA